MAFTWSRHQIDAIEKHGENLLVSAAAGSGKTAVLTERVIQKIKQGVDIKRLVILTFTNKAAQEMRARIRQSIQKEASLHHVLADLEQAHIQTFDSYALYILKTYGHHLNISKQLSMLDQADANMLKAQLMDQLFLDYYEAGDQAFLDFIDTHASKSDQLLMDALLNMYNGLSLDPERHVLFDYLEQGYFTPEHFEALFERFRQLILMRLRDLHQGYDRLKDDFSHPKLVEVFDHDLNAWPKVEDQASYDDIAQAVQTIKFKRKPTVKDDALFEEESDMFSKKRDQIKKLVDALKKDTEHFKADHLKRFMALKPDVEIVVKLLKTFEARYKAYQIKHERFDFATTAMTAYDIIQSFPSVRDTLKANIHEVMVDEYQDTNQLQEQFVLAITDNNLYMVGDVKQSIYRFRHADPSIFVDKYLTFKQAKKGTVVDLNENYRSREAVLKDINHVFEHTMDRTLGGIDYDAQQRLNYGNKSFDDHYQQDATYGLNLHLYDAQDTQALSTHELEFFKMATLIKEKVARQDLIKDGDQMRPIQYGDVTILLDKKSRFEMAAKIFAYEGVPLNVHQSDAFLYQTDMMSVKQVLTLILALVDEATYHQQFKQAFMSVTRSFLYAFDDDDIVRQLLKFPKHFTNTTDLLDRFETPFMALKKLMAYGVNQGRFQPLAVLLDVLFETLDYDQKLLALFGTKAALHRKEHLLALSRKQSELGLDLKAFVRYFDQLFKAEQDIEVTSASDFNSGQVNLMTMHKSKGLQFPVVMVSGLETKFQRQHPNMVIDRDLGLLLKVEDGGLSSTFLSLLYNHKELEATISEKLRLWYVALTRAVEEIHLVAPQPDEGLKTPETMVPYLERLSYRSFYDVMMSVSGHFQASTYAFDATEYESKHDYDVVQKQASLPKTTQLEKLYKPFNVHTEVQKTTRFSGGVSSFLEASALEAIAYGNLLHDALEHVDFDAVEASLAAMPLDAEAKDHLKRFFKLPLLHEEPLIGVYKEFPFVVEADTTFSQGFVDLVLETPSKMIVIDYKLKNIDNPDYDQQVKGYCETLKDLQQKPVEGYLYSILSGQLKHVI